jgi:hypothetical protein
MLLLVLAAAAIQAAPAPSPSPELRQQLACPSAKGLQARTVAARGLPAIHRLNQEPDAAMIKPVARNYCEEADIVRYSVSPGQTEQKPQRQAK